MIEKNVSHFYILIIYLSVRVSNSQEEKLNHILLRVQDIFETFSERISLLI